LFWRQLGISCSFGGVHGWKFCLLNPFYDHQLQSIHCIWYKPLVLDLKDKILLCYTITKTKYLSIYPKLQRVHPFRRICLVLNT
jgi:hypothetical protein